MAFGAVVPGVPVTSVTMSQVVAMAVANVAVCPAIVPVTTKPRQRHGDEADPAEQEYQRVVVHPDFEANGFSARRLNSVPNRAS